MRAAGDDLVRLDDLTRVAPYCVRVTPLQKVAMGLLVVFLPANFPAHPHPPWMFFDALPDPIGWILVLLGLRALARTGGVDLGYVLGFAVLALVVSVPLWVPQVTHAVIASQDRVSLQAFRWAASLPQIAFSLLLCRELSRSGARQQPRDRYIAGRFGVLTWLFVADAVLPAVVYGVGLSGAERAMELFVGLVQVVLIYYLFMANRRTFLGGPGPRDWTRHRAVRERD